MPINPTPLKVAQILAAIKLLDRENLDEKTEQKLLKNIFSSLNNRNAISPHHTLDLIDSLLSNDDGAINLTDFPRAERAIKTYIKLHKPIVNVGVNYYGEQVVIGFTLFTNPLTLKKQIDSPDIGANASTGCNEYFREMYAAADTAIRVDLILPGAKL